MKRQQSEIERRIKWRLHEVVMSWTSGKGGEGGGGWEA